jgi:AcrR family transcriptional regulator
MAGNREPERGSEEGLRERKRRETRQRIAETALDLFLTGGYEETTLDAIAEKAQISRRTFFSYFNSKDEILVFWQNSGWARMYEELLTTSPDVAPIDAVRDLMVKFISRYSTDEMAALDKLMRSSSALMASKQTFYANQEVALFNALCEVWRQPERRPALRMVAMASIGAMRLAIQAWYEQVGQRKPMAKFLKDAFASLKAEL